MPEAFGEAPEVMRGFMRREAEKAWRNWNPLIWGVIRYRGCFGEPPKAEPVTQAGAAPPQPAAKAVRAARLSAVPELPGAPAAFSPRGGRCPAHRRGEGHMAAHTGTWRRFC